MVVVRIAIASLPIIVAGCSTQQEPDLVRLYAPVAQRPKTVPLIVIPGIMGSRLIREDTKQELWPGPLTGLLFGHDFADLALPIPGAEQIPGSPRTIHLETGGFFHELAGEDFYARIIRTLSDAAGYTCVPRDQVTATTNCVLFSWDWRKGIVVAATELEELIEQLRSLRHDPMLKVDIVAHSAGGLVTRYFSRFGGKDVLDETDPEITLSGGKKLRQAILIETPNYGSITVLQKAIMGDRIVRAKLQAETIATMPGMFQLLPHPDRTWMVDIMGRRLDTNLYDVATWRQHHWSIWDPAVHARIVTRFAEAESATAYMAALEAHFEHQLQRAARFHRALSVPFADTPNKFIVFGSACFPTPARCLLEEIDGRAYISLQPSQIRRPVAGIRYDELMFEPGDGAVTKASLLARDSLDPDAAGSDFPIAWAVFVCERHDKLPANTTFRDNLLNIVLYGVRQSSGRSVLQENGSQK